jgi:hypothetical protein
MIKRYVNNNIVVTQYTGNGPSKYNIEFSRPGDYGIPSYYYIYDELINELPLSELEKSKSNTLLATDKVYFNKSSTIPRYKLKDFLERSKIELNRTNRIDYADTLVIGINTYKTLIYDRSTTQKYLVIPINDAVNYVSQKASFINDAKNKGITEVLLRESSADNLNISKNKYPSVNIRCIDNRWGGAKDSDIVESFVYLANNKNKKIIFDETLVEACNADTIIDLEMYETLRTMFGSSSKENNENIKLGIEIMSNSDFINSKLFILLLLNEFTNEIRRQPKTPNFQNLLNYFVGDSNDAMSNSWEVFSDKLIKKICKNEDEVNIVKNYVLNSLNKMLKNSHSKLTLKDISL